MPDRDHFVFKSVNKMIEQSIRDNWDRPALSNYKGATLAYRDVAVRIAKVHLAFKECGLLRGDKVAICGRNQANWAVTFLAAMTYGAVPVPLLHEFKPGNIHYLVNHSGAKVLFVDEGIWDNLSETEMPRLYAAVQINNWKLLYTRSKVIQHAREHLNEMFGVAYPNTFEKEDFEYYEDSADELALINYTSGTSGFSKGVMIPYRALSSNIQFAHDFALPNLDNECNVVSMLPCAHMYGMMFEFLFEMTIGMHVHFLTRLPSPKIIMQAFADIKPDIIISVPLIIEKVYKSKLKPIIDRNKLIMKVPVIDKVIEKKMKEGLVDAFGGKFYEVIIGGAAFNPEVETFMKKIGFPVTVGYGMTEGAPILAYSDWKENRLYSCGKSAPFMKTRIDSSDPATVPGEIQVTGPNVMLGYYKNEEATKESFTEDGWLKTGDMGVIDSEGNIYIKGRSKCMLLGPSGQNIYPEELEAVINTVTYVVDSLVISDEGALTALIYPDYHQGEVDGLSAEALADRIRSAMPEVNKQLPAYAQIKKVEFMPEDFERTPKRSIKRYLYQRDK